MKKLFRKIEKQTVRGREGYSSTCITNFDLDSKKIFGITLTEDDGVRTVAIRSYIDGKLHNTKKITSKKLGYVQDRYFFYDGEYPSLTVEDGKVVEIIRYNDDKTQGVIYNINGNRLIGDGFIGCDASSEESMSEIACRRILWEKGFSYKYKDTHEQIIENVLDGDGYLESRKITNIYVPCIIEEKYVYYDDKPRDPTGPVVSDYESVIRYGEIYRDIISQNK